MGWNPRTWGWGWGGWIGLLALVLVIIFLKDPVIEFFQAVLGKLKGAD